MSKTTNPTSENVCPRCSGGIPNSTMPGAYPGALSRWDNHTEVCSYCGSEEAAFALFAASTAQKNGEDVDEAINASVNPSLGIRPWRVQP
jgi:hypothetical protein